jgi:putative ABC transport system substrate-binding protein
MVNVAGVEPGEEIAHAGRWSDADQRGEGRGLALAAQHRLPAVYSDRVFVMDGGLMCYTTDRADQFKAAASYIDRILRGAKPSDLPVQVPTRYATVINLKTAKRLGLSVPPALLVAADEVIE